MCDCSNLPEPFTATRHHGQIERCPSCDTPWKLVVRRRGTFITKDWERLSVWDIPAHIRAARIPKRWS